MTREKIGDEWYLLYMQAKEYCTVRLKKETIIGQKGVFSLNLGTHGLELYGRLFEGAGALYNVTT